jgi:hypothetical protein
MRWKWSRRRREPAFALPAVSGERAERGAVCAHMGAVVLEVSHAEMNDALCAGTAVPLGDGLPWVTWYASAWWVHYEGGWLRVTDESVAAELDDVAARLGEATAAVEGNEPLTRHSP